MRTSTRQNILYDYRYLNIKEEVKCNLKNAFHMRRDYTKMEEEENFTIVERVMILGGITGAMTCVYMVLSYLV